MKTIYQIKVEIPTAPLILRRTFYVESRAELEALRDAAHTQGYNVVGFTVAHTMTALEVAKEIAAEKAKAASEA